MRTLILIIIFIMGSWMIADGIHVILYGSYIGPEKPGPWADLVYMFGFDPTRFGLIFLALGIDWVIGGAGILLDRRWGYYLTLIMALLSLWYIPFGTVLSIAIIMITWFYLKKQASIHKQS